MSIVLMGSTSGSCTLQEQAVAGSSTINLPVGTGTAVVNGVNGSIVSGTAVASTSGTSIDFTGIPSWVKRITVMFNSVSTNGTSNFQVQIGSGSVTTSGYTSTELGSQSSGVATTNSSTGFVFYIGNSAAETITGNLVINLISSNNYISTSMSGAMNAARTTMAAGNVTLGGVLDRVRITTVNGTDTFDAGSVNILYE